jgi:hypothetical protein
MFYLAPQSLEIGLAPSNSGHRKAKFCKMFLSYCMHFLKALELRENYLAGNYCGEKYVLEWQFVVAIYCWYVDFTLSCD